MKREGKSLGHASPPARSRSRCRTERSSPLPRDHSDRVGDKPVSTRRLGKAVFPMFSNETLPQQASDGVNAAGNQVIANTTHDFRVYWTWFSALFLAIPPFRA
jgi:hypothetical protein